jgi:hypothetical protein
MYRTILADPPWAGCAIATNTGELTMTDSIIDRDIDFYSGSLEQEKRIMRSCAGAKDEQIAADCAKAATEVLQALRRYRIALHLAGRLDPA